MHRHVGPTSALGLQKFAPELDLPETEKAASQVLSLPIHPSLTQDDLERIVGAVNTLAKAGA
ncbi:DegT/DnrJ/EryC1/StrS aminotransferase family protein [Corynebacterium glutamicum]|nr:DegT/DnrJ/EryC1/StrS aminotransferase family protein [Corynebacterium glutamicum]QDQ23541.1 DegT/DnrJ/EryC1/StrS aminotransferase family protein [Corynebacterium glutamicum]